MWVRVGLVSAVAWVAGCYRPSPQQGLPCSETSHTCPGDQVCDLTQVPPTCVDELPDPIDGGIDPDAPDAAVIPCGQGCPAAQPVCDSMTDTCRKCIADSDCPGACHELAGTCTSAAETIYVAPGGSDNPTCSQLAPCGSIETAAGVATATRKLVRVEDGTYAEAFSVNGDVIISGTDIPAAGVSIQPPGGMGSVQLDGQTMVIEGITFIGTNNDAVINRGTATFSRVLVRNAQRNGFDNRGGTLILRDCRISGGSGAGINSNSFIDVQRTEVLGNNGGGIITNGGFSIINTVIANNGNGNGVGGARLGGSVGSMNVFRFNTVTKNSAQAGTAAGVQCDQPITLADSIFAANSGLLTTEVSGNCTSRYSLFDSNPPNGMGNVQGNPMFVNAMSDFHLTAGSPAIDKADPMATESFDYEGDARPTGMARDIGADERP